MFDGLGVILCFPSQDLVNMVESGGQSVSTAMFSMNQMSAGQQHNTVKRRNKSTTTHDKKKMFEEVSTTFNWIKLVLLNNNRLLLEFFKLFASYTRCWRNLNKIKNCPEG